MQQQIVWLRHMDYCPQLDWRFLCAYKSQHHLPIGVQLFVWQATQSQPAAPHPKRLDQLEAATSFADMSDSSDKCSVNNESDSIVAGASAPPSVIINNCAARIFAASADEEICISGMSGQFPASQNVAEFEENLYNKVGNILWNMFRTEQFVWVTSVFIH